MARTAVEEALLSGVNLHVGAKFSDGTFPHNFWVSPNGNDGLGNGSFDAPFATVKRGIRQARDNRGDRVIVGSGSYAETVDIGSGGTTYGISGGYAKRGLQIIGDDSVHNGRVQIIGDGSTAQATLRVLTDYLAGFVLKHVELDTNGVAQPALHLVTSNTASGSQSNPSIRFAVANVAVRSNDPSVGVLLEGATLGDLHDLHIEGPTLGIALAGSASNIPRDLKFWDIDFMDCVTADICTLTQTSPTIIGSPGALANIQFRRMRHWDRGGTPVTHYVNMVGAGYVNVHFFDCWAARDVGDGTLLELPANVVWIGQSAAAAEYIIGS